MPSSSPAKAATWRRALSCQAPSPVSTHSRAKTPTRVPLPAGHCVVVAVLAAHDQVGGIVGGDEVAAAFGIGEMPVEHGDQRLRLVEVAHLAGRLEQRDAGARHVGVVVERAAMQPLAGAMGMEQPAVVVAHPVHDEAPGADRGGQPVVALEHGGGVGERGDHQAVPVGQHLVVPARPHALVAHRLQPGAQAGQSLLLGVAQQRRRAIAMQDGVMLPVALRRDVVDLLEEGRHRRPAPHRSRPRPRHRTCPRRPRSRRRRSRRSRRPRPTISRSTQSQVSAMRVA